jgi:lipopolysaccharide export system permease protein
MRLLDRYLLRELLLPLGYCLSGFFIFWASADLITNLDSYQEDRLSLLDLVRFYFFRAPEFMVVVVPMALLLALLYALTNHARHQELTAMRSAGWSLWRICQRALARGKRPAGRTHPRAQLRRQRFRRRPGLGGEPGLPQ